MINRIEFQRFRGFRKLQADLVPHAYIVGPNSAGKSTVLEAIGLAEACLRIARRKSPVTIVKHRGLSWRGFTLPTIEDDQDDPIRFDFGVEETSVSVSWDSGGEVHVVWPEESEDGMQGKFYVSDGEGSQPRTLQAIRELFIPTAIVPVVTPLDRYEELKNPEYVESQSNTRLASRHFRNHAWQLSQAGKWDAFKDYCRTWLPEIELLDVTLGRGVNQLAVFYVESGSRVPKELAWAGDGIQIWVQLLWHLCRAQNAATIVLDEPEVYLHPDLQRRLVRLLDGTSAQIILASHSTDVISEAPTQGIMWVDRRHGTARRVKSQQALSDLSASLGSSYNLALAKSMRSRLVVATDCEDLRVIRQLAKSVGAMNFSNEQTTSLVPLLDVGKWSGAQLLGKSLRDVLPPKLPAVILLQGGHRPPQLNSAILNHLNAPDIRTVFLNRAELENYLLDADTISRASGAPMESVELKLQEILEQFRESTRAAFAANWVGAAVEGLTQQSLKDAESTFDAIWQDKSRRIEIVRGTVLIKGLNIWLVEQGYRAISGYALSKRIRPQLIPNELFRIILDIDADAK